MSVKKNYQNPDQKGVNKTIVEKMFGHVDVGQS